MRFAIALVCVALAAWCLPSVCAIATATVPATLTPTNFFTDASYTGTHPFAMATNPVDDSLWIMSDNNSLQRVAAGSRIADPAITLASLGFPSGVTSRWIRFDAAGALFMLVGSENPDPSQANKVFKTTFTSTTAGSTAVFIASVTNPAGITFDAEGNVYISSHATSGYISKYSSAGVLITASYSTNIRACTDLAFNSVGQLFTVCNGDGFNPAMFRVPFGGGAADLFAYTGTWGVRADAADHLWVTDDSQTNSMRVFDGTSGALLRAYAIPGQRYQAIIIRANGDLVVIDENAAKLFLFAATTPGPAQFATLSAPTSPPNSTCKADLTLSSVLSTPAAGIAVTFTVDQSSAGVATAASCTGVTDATGKASCAIQTAVPSGQAGFPVTAKAAFNVPSSATAVSVSTRTFSVSSVSYTGPLSVSTRGYLAASVSAQPISVGGANVDGVASFSYGSSSSCSSPASLVDGVYSGRCQLTAPLSSGSFALTSSVSYTADACDVYVGSVDTQIAVLELAASRDAQSAATSAVRANVTALAALEASLALQVNGEVSRAVAAEAVISSAVSTEGARAAAAESALQANFTSLSVRLSAAEAQLSAPAVFMFRGLSASVSVSYVAPQRPGFGAANQLNFVLKFDQSLASTAAGVISYSASTGVLSISAAGSYRLDAFVHLYDVTAGSVGSGVVAWLDPAGVPVGPNILNANGGGVAQGVPGDDSIISSIVVVPSTVSAAAPFTCKLVLLSMNHKQATITDASTFSVTKLK